MSLLVRAAVVLLCAAGIVASAISYRSQKRLDDGFTRVLRDGKLDSRSRELLEGSSALNPDTRREVLLARIAQYQGREWEPLIQDALEQEPENASVHAAYVNLLVADGRSADARRAFERGRRLDQRTFTPDVAPE